MTRLLGHGRAKYQTGSRLGSSRDTDWRHMLAERWRHAPGELGPIEPRETEVVVMVRGASARVKRRGDGLVQDADAGPGTVWLCPAGIREDRIEIYGDIGETVHMYLPAAPLSLSALADVDVDPDNVRLRYEGGFRDPLIEQIGLSVLREMQDPAPGSRLLIDTLSAALSAHIIRHYSNLSPAAARLPRLKGALDNRRLNAVLDFVEAHLEQNLTLQELADEAGLSAYHFARAFKTAVGHSPHAYLNQRRVARARRLLSEGEAPLADVALACGFCSQPHFTRAFKGATGLTPGVFRMARGRALA
ncbi:MAG: AraC family transcriptional regulator [Alphaproteobacteria bacterium]